MTGLSVLMGLDSLFHFYLVITMILRQIDDPIYSKTINVVAQLTEIPVTNRTHLAIQCMITVFFILMIAAFITVVVKTHSLATLSSMPTIKKVLTLLFVAMMTCLQIPFIEMIMSMAFIKFKEQAEVTSQGELESLRGTIYAFAIINGALFFGWAFLLQKLYIIRIPSIQVHWAASNTQLHSMKLINKIALVLCHLYITTVEGASQQLFASVPLFILFAGTGLSRIMLIPHYRQLVEWYTRLTEIITGCLFLILIVAQVVASNRSSAGVDGGSADLHLCLLVGFVSIPCSIGLAVVLDLNRQRQLWAKLEGNELRIEIELEHSLYLLIERVKVAMGFDDKSALAFADILYLVDNHNRTCNNHNCPCQRRQIVQYLLNKGHTYDIKKLELDEEEIALLNSAGTNVFIKSNKNNQAIKTLTLFQHFNFYAAAAAAELSDNPVTKGGGGDAAEDDPLKQKVRVNIAQLKVTFLNQFAEIFFEEA
ncbi:hypothetical protein FGO68_gene6495 [Halteria grandinella]|uniref:Uncharacterized protein n=1 Tax=Halteria grandinella TaxID=5974 RepID=A0A8J8TAB6_HALGN|nr:hypothetical protein FGO68_gene6495 [Halteria grandinella]